MVPHTPPDGLPIYRLLSGPDDESFCRKVSQALVAGYKLYGSPALTVKGKTAYVAQAVVWPTAEVAIAQAPAESAARKRSR